MTMRTAIALLVLVTSAGCPAGPPYFIPGTATLPDCSTAPDVQLARTRWSSSGTLTITSLGCRDVSVDDALVSCPLTWVISAQLDGDLSIIVDGEYRLRGRLCGDQLHLEGGFWLPLVDGDFGCTYEEDSAAEVRIQREASVLTVQSPTQIAGTLALQEACAADYALVLTQL